MRLRSSGTWLMMPTVLVVGAQGVEDVEDLVEGVFVEGAEAFVDEQGSQGAPAGFLRDDVGQAEGEREGGGEGLASGQGGGLPFGAGPGFEDSPSRLPRWSNGHSPRHSSARRN